MLPKDIIWEIVCIFDPVTVRLAVICQSSRGKMYP